ncbi:hypothetical protein VP01_1266g6 [Puccinia sorghi]|uniref:Myb/SANT-like domain-containing protein n=1 Tax=Puccinia sorghi TaxID=27349 RepID=A0A0L6VP34_9BASI|nr:hypothetical protein VP01_1266g6 [Puccinia sorghi]
MAMSITRYSPNQNSNSSPGCYMAVISSHYLTPSRNHAILQPLESPQPISITNGPFKNASNPVTQRCPWPLKQLQQVAKLSNCFGQWKWNTELSNYMYRLSVMGRHWTKVKSKLNQNNTGVFGWNEESWEVTAPEQSHPAVRKLKAKPFPEWFLLLETFQNAFATSSNQISSPHLHTPSEMMDLSLA